MAATTFDEALRRLLAHEGGYANHPSRSRRADQIRHHARGLSPKREGRRERRRYARRCRSRKRKAIYRLKYWNALACDQLPAGLDYAVFDYGVNSGAGRAARVLRRLVGAPAGTRHRCRRRIARVAARDDRKLVDALCDERLAFLRRLKTFAGVRQRLDAARRRGARGLARAGGRRRAPVPPAKPATIASPARRACRQGRRRRSTGRAMRHGRGTARGGRGRRRARARERRVSGCRRWRSCSSPPWWRAAAWWFWRWRAAPRREQPITAMRSLSRSISKDAQMNWNDLVGSLLMKLGAPLIGGALGGPLGGGRRQRSSPKHSARAKRRRRR